MCFTTKTFFRLKIVKAKEEKCPSMSERSCLVVQAEGEGTKVSGAGEVEG